MSIGRKIKPELVIGFLLTVIFLNSCSVLKNPYNLDIIESFDEYRASLSTDPDNELVDLVKYIPGIIPDVRYSTENNFTGKRVYPRSSLFARKPVADSLLRVQNELNALGLTLIIFDAYRPYSVSLKFFKILPDTNYVASPRKASRHNYGCAVDVSIAEITNKKELEMPTSFDDFTEKAWLNYSDLPAEAIKNRDLLIHLMRKYGFLPYEAEWWHYTYYGWKRFKIMDLSFNNLIKNNKY